MTVYFVRSISMSPDCFGVEAVGAMAVMRSPVTMMVWAAGSAPVLTSRRWPVRTRVRVAVCAETEKTAICNSISDR